MSKSSTPLPSEISNADRVSDFHRARQSRVASMKHRCLMTKSAPRGLVGAERRPLWYYVQREADVRCGGNRLGPVGARIVGEVLLGLLDLDPGSVRHAPDDWRPSASLIQLLGHA